MTLLKQGGYEQLLDPCLSETSDCSHVGKCDIGGADVDTAQLCPHLWGVIPDPCATFPGPVHRVSLELVMPVDRQPSLKSQVAGGG